MFEQIYIQSIYYLCNKHRIVRGRCSMIEIHERMDAN